MDIQRLRTDEVDRLRAIRLRALRDAPEAFCATFEQAAGWGLSNWARQLAELATFVAVVEGADVGLVRGGAHEVGQRGVAKLISMWVAPEVRGRDIGVALIDTVVGWARGEGFTRLVLEVGDANAAAIALYNRKGFRPTGVTGTFPPPRVHIREHELALGLGVGDVSPVS